jgi:hypothetical protein
MNDLDLVYCQCNECGSSLDVFYDVKNDEYICRECLNNHEENEND